MKDRFIAYFSRFAPLTETEAQTILDGVALPTATTSPEHSMALNGPFGPEQARVGGQSGALL